MSYFDEMLNKVVKMHDPENKLANREPEKPKVQRKVELPESLLPKEDETDEERINRIEAQAKAGDEASRLEWFRIRGFGGELKPLTGLSLEKIKTDKEDAKLKAENAERKARAEAAIEKLKRDHEMRDRQSEY